MNLSMYQDLSQKTDLHPQTGGTSLEIPLFGLAGETGELLSEYKKYLRDGDAHVLFKERMAEELGDLLWYVANVATKCDLSLDDIAQINLAKCGERWGGLPDRPIFDEAFPEKEKLPREFSVEFRTQEQQGSPSRVQIYFNGEQFGDELTDNAHAPDGYGYHDVLHFAFAAILGWSPLVRKMRKCKRKSAPMVDEVEDGARAIVTEEGVSAMVFAFARQYHFLEGKHSVSAELLKTIKNIVNHLEVGICTTGEWERAIIAGMEAWRQINLNKGGIIDCNLRERSLNCRKVSVP